jgi:hypothetical protein
LWLKLSIARAELAKGISMSLIDDARFPRIAQFIFPKKKSRNDLQAKQLSAVAASSSFHLIGQKLRSVESKKSETMERKEAAREDNTLQLIPIIYSPTVALRRIMEKVIHFDVFLSLEAPKVAQQKQDRVKKIEKD